jgi:anti-sigma factor RsiW
MNPNADDKPLREKIWRHDLTPAEQAELRAWLSGHPEAASDLETERKLTALLGGLPDAPVPSNFTARVLQAVEQEARATERNRTSRPWWLRGWLPRTSAALAVVALGYVGYQRYESAQQRAALVKELQEMNVAAVPSAETLEDFEAIRHLTPATGLAGDPELLSLFSTSQ